MNNSLYVPLEDALNIMWTISDESQSLDKMRELRALPTIDLSIIDEMSEDIWEWRIQFHGEPKMYICGILKKLKEKLSHKN